MKKYKSLGILLSFCVLTACSTNNEPFTFDSKCCKDLIAVVMAEEKIEVLPENIAVSQVDLNNDERIDFLAQIQSPFYCGSSGCSLRIFIQKNEGLYKEIKGPSVTFSSFKLKENSTSGMDDMVFPGRWGEECTWSWNIDKYEFVNCSGKF